MKRTIAFMLIMTIALQYFILSGATITHVYFGDRTVEKVYMNGILERKLKLRSRLNTHLIYKK